MSEQHAHHHLQQLKHPSFGFPTQQSFANQFAIRPVGAIVRVCPRAISHNTNALDLSKLPTDLMKEILSQLDLSSQKSAALAEKGLGNVFRREQTSLRLPGAKLAEALRRFTNVQRIKITQAPSTQDIAKIVGNKENVQHLDLSGCHQLTDAAITALANRCQNLTSLNLNHCRHLTDAAITALANQCPNLTSLDFYGCFQLTDTAITTLANQSPNLTSLDLIRCEQITYEAITALRERYPQLIVRH